VITRRAAETQGTLLVAGAGNLERGAAARRRKAGRGRARFGSTARISDRGHTSRATALPSRQLGQRPGGFRADLGNGGRAFTLQGDAYRGTIDQTAAGDIRISGRNLLGRWARQLAGGDRVQVQAYFDTPREFRAPSKSG